MTVAACESCGMPLEGAADHALGNPTLPWCRHCAPNGVLPDPRERLERFTQFIVATEGLDHDAARARARAHMLSMPAWRNSGI
jgi:hypothetical protein